MIERALCPVLIGREPQLTLLEDALLAANRGQGQIVLLGGEAGLGKTRLATELQARAGRIGMTVMWGGCSEADVALPYLPFLESIGNFLAASDLEIVRRQLGPIRRELAHMFPQLDPETVVRQGDDPAQSKLRLFEAVLALLQIPAGQHGLLLVLEDLHWADASTRELLDYMTRRLRKARILLVGTYRTDELHRKHPLLPTIQGWRRAGLAQVIELGPLPPASVADMVEAIFDQPIREEFRNFLHARSEGNPFILEEMLKAAIDEGDIFRGAERWERKELAEMKLPDTVRETILLRVERLGEAQAEILRIAAVLGPSFGYQALVAVSGRDDDAVQSALQACVQQQLMEEDPVAAEQYRFRHALTREAIYEELIAPRRKRLHARAADVLRDLPGTQPVDLAHHLLAAGRTEEAVPVCIKAAEDAERRRGYGEAAELYARVLPHLGDGTLLSGQILCRAGHARYLNGEFGKAQPYLEEGIAILDRFGEPRDAAKFRLALARCHWQRSRPDLAHLEYERARASLEPFGPSEDLAVAYVRLAGLKGFDLEGAEAVALGQKAVAVAEAAHADGPRIWAYNFIGLGLEHIGQIDEGTRFLERSYREATEHGFTGIAANAAGNSAHLLLANFKPREGLARAQVLPAAGLEWASFAGLMEGHAWQLMGEPGRAMAALEKGLALAGEAQSSTMGRRMHTAMGLSSGSLNDFERARGLLVPPQPTDHRHEANNRRRARMRVSFDAGDIDEARREVETVMAQFRWGRYPATEEVWVIDQLAEVLIATGELDQAQRLLDNLLTTGVKASSPFVARIEGRLASSRGQSETAIDRLTAAAEYFARVEYLDDEWRTRRALAEVKATAGDRAGAETELQRVFTAASAHGHNFEVQAAERRLREWKMGVPEVQAVPPVLPTRQPTERLISVLFVDIRGYTAMSAREAPDRVVDTVASFHRWARQEIERHHGLVDKYEGDAVMATFNVTSARLDHALHALQAAIAIRDKATAAGLPVGAAIAVGPAVVGQLTAGGHVSAYGEVTNLASRLQGQAAAGEVLLSEEAYRRTRDWLSSQRQIPHEEALPLKGLEHPVTAFRLYGRNGSPG